ncbi:MAG: sensor histidine kinase [Christensenellaceae bacterium]
MAKSEKNRKPRRISTIIVFYFSLFMVVILTAMSFISYYYSYENMKRRTIQDTEVILSQVGKNIGRYIANTEDISGIINADKALTSYLALDYESASEAGRARVNFTNFLEYIPKIGDDIVAIFVFDKNNAPIYVPKDLTLKQGYDITQDEWFKDVQNTHGESVLTGTQVRVMTEKENPWVISLSRRIIDNRNNQIIGTQHVELNYRAIDKILSDINLGSKGYVFIVDKDGKYIYHPQLQLIYSGLKNEDIDEILATNLKTLENVKENKMYTISNVAGTDFKMVGVTFLDELVSAASEMNMIYIILALAMVGAAIIGSVELAKLITRPLDKLENAVNEVEQGNLDAKFEIKGTIETEKFASSLSSMTSTVKQLMEQIMEDQEMIRTSEIKALQSQINPHFLYNTLDSIVWIAEEAGNEQIKEMTVALANYFRIVLSSGKDIIDVADEISHIENYLVIQKMRYENLDFEIDVDKELLHLKMPKLILQPIVENAIYHGIKNNTNGGKIVVRGYIKDEKLFFEICDNGRGMRENELENIFKQKTRQRIRQGGVGLNNVRERIELYYGAEYGIRFKSKFKEGTIVTITLPIRHETNGGKEPIK